MENNGREPKTCCAVGKYENYCEVRIAKLEAKLSATKGGLALAVRLLNQDIETPPDQPILYTEEMLIEIERNQR